MFDFVVEGRREWLLGPIGFLHPYKGLKLFAAENHRIANGATFRIAALWYCKMSTKRSAGVRGRRLNKNPV